jgi:hypothetical protein
VCVQCLIGKQRSHGEHRSVCCSVVRHHDVFGDPQARPRRRERHHYRESASVAHQVRGGCGRQPLSGPGDGGGCSGPATLDRTLDYVDHNDSKNRHR